MNPSIVPTNASKPLPTSLAPDPRQTLLTEIENRAKTSALELYRILFGTLAVFMNNCPNVPYVDCQAVFEDICEGRITRLAREDGSIEPNLTDRLKSIELAAMAPNPEDLDNNPTDEAESVEEPPTEAALQREISRITPSMRGKTPAQIRLVARRRLALIGMIVDAKVTNPEPMAWAIAYVKNYVLDSHTLKLWFDLVRNYEQGSVTAREIAKAIPMHLRNVIGDACVAAALTSAPVQTAQEADAIATQRKQNSPYATGYRP